MKTLKWNMVGLSKLAGLSAIAIIAVAGCGNKDEAGTASTGGESGNTATGKSVDQNFGDTGNAVAGVGQSVANGVENSGNAASNVAAAAGNQVAGAGNAVASGVGSAGVAVKNMGSAAVNTPAIKTALGASKAMAGSNVNVDTTATAVTLSGTVKSAMQKSMAASIAKSKAGGLKIVNKLTVKK